MEKNSCTQIVIENLHKHYKLGAEKNRYEMVVVVSSFSWETGGKFSVWIEDIKAHGKTILCSFDNKCPRLREPGFLQVGDQYYISGALIHYNRATYCRVSSFLKDNRVMSRVGEISHEFCEICEIGLLAK